MSTLKISIKTGTIGPRHDPYGTTTVTITTPAGQVEHYSDGLGSLRVTVNGDVLLDSVGADDGPVQDYASQLFESHAGISLSAAQDTYYEPRESDEFDDWGWREKRSMWDI